MDPKVNIERDATWTAAPTESAPTETKVSTVEPSVLGARDRQRYDIIGEHGRGGLGRVFRAHDRELGRDVALKELLQRGHGGELRFFREALVTARLEHPGIVPVHEAGRWSDGTPFYAMKLVAGRSLKQLIDDKPTLENRLPLIANLIAVADAMAYAHDRRIIHRDLKPANVMVGDFGETIVIDWGLAKALDDDSPDEDDVPYRTPARSELTAAGTSLGTPAYMAPEQFGGKVDQRADIYALGGLLYHILVGSPPHDKVDARTAEAPTLPRTVPEDLAAIVARAMERDPERRYSSARALAEDLRRYQRHDRVSARSYSLVARLGLAFERHRAVATVAMLALVALTATFGVAALKISHRRAEADVAKQRAQISNATALLERDPTNAWQVLRDVPTSADTALLRARIRAAGVAARSVALPGRVDQMLAVDEHRVLFSTGERRLFMFDPETSALSQIADGLTSPAVWMTTEDAIYFVRQRPYLAIARIALPGGPASEIARIDHLPESFDADAHRVWWTIDRALFSAGPDEPSHRVTDDVDYFVVGGDDVAWCHDGALLHARDSAALDTCTKRDDIFSSSWGFGYAAPEALHTFRAGEKRIVDRSAVAKANIRRVTATGVLLGELDAREAVYLRPGATSFEHVVFSSDVTDQTSRDDVIAWGFGDGSVEIRDTLHRREWRIQAQADQLHCLSFVTARTLITCSRLELRVWTLPEDGAITLAKLPFPANTLAFDDHGTALFDGVDGTAFALSAGSDTVKELHRHTDSSYGAAWCDGEACTSSLDGSVMCTNLSTGTTHTAKLDSATAFLSAGAGHCVTITTSGTVFDVRTATPLYRHAEEPYRVAVSDDGARTASVDWAGNVKVYDATHHSVVADKQVHRGQITDVAWAKDAIATVGIDGRFVVSSTALVPQHDWQLGAPARYMVVAAEHAGIGLDDGTLIFASTRDGVLKRFATHDTFASFAIAQDGSAIAAGTRGGELFVVTASGRTAAARFEHGRVSCLAFERADVIDLCAPSGRIVRIPLSALSFED